MGHGVFGWSTSNSTLKNVKSPIPFLKVGAHLNLYLIFLVFLDKFKYWWDFFILLIKMPGFFEFIMSWNLSVNVLLSYCWGLYSLIFIKISNNFTCDVQFNNLNKVGVFGKTQFLKQIGIVLFLSIFYLKENWIVDAKFWI